MGTIAKVLTPATLLNLHTGGVTSSILVAPTIYINSLLLISPNYLFQSPPNPHRTILYCILRNSGPPIR